MLASALVQENQALIIVASIEGWSNRGICILPRRLGHLRKSLVLDRICIPSSRLLILFPEIHPLVCHNLISDKQPWVLYFDLQL